MSRKAIVVAVIVAAGCGSEDSKPGGPGGPDGAPTVDAAQLRVEQRAPGTTDRVVGLAGAASGASRVRIFGEGGNVELASGSVSADGAFDAIDVGDNEHERLWVVAANEAGSSQPVELTNDIVAPDVGLSGGPADPAATRSATFVLDCSESACTYACELDGTTIEECRSPVELTDLDDGAHRFEVRAIDAAGNAGDVKFHEWNVVLSSPVVTLVERPGPITQATEARFGFTCSMEGCTFECALDDGALSPCTSPTVHTVDEGDHTFAVRGIVGRTAGETTVHEWRVDRSAPLLQIEQMPDTLTISSDAVFHFGCEGDEVCTYSCTLDDGAELACISPRSYFGLAEGPHTFTVAAVDEAGNEAVATWSWTIDRTGPSGLFVRTPPNQTTADAADFTFSCDDLPCTYACALDSTVLQPCEETFSTSGLAEGVHHMRLQATDAIGNTGSVALFTWERDLTGPGAEFISMPRPIEASTSASFDFRCDDPPCSYTCSLDGATAAGCLPPVQLSSLAEGDHRLEVVPSDAAGNTGDPIAFSWSIDTTPPVITLVGAPSGTTNVTDVDIQILCSEPDCTYTCSISGGRPQSCTSPWQQFGLRDASYTLDVVGTDPAGNTGTASASWVVDTSAQ
ncbi:hypothetical protein [Vulgatibacter sp.]|uniref:hypothetical protein n=1 Tax=Vulgatibacter sp. TaxID=1971226 RepID=UPI003561A276